MIVSDGNAFFNRPGPRLVESLEIMAAWCRSRASCPSGTDSSSCR
jgi:hypothetical protein